MSFRSAIVGLAKDCFAAADSEFHVNAFGFPRRFHSSARDSRKSRRVLQKNFVHPRKHQNLRSQAFSSLATCRLPLYSGCIQIARQSISTQRCRVNSFLADVLALIRRVKDTSYLLENIGHCHVGAEYPGLCIRLLSRKE